MRTNYQLLAAETESHEGKRKQESLWPIFKIHHQKSRYIYDLFYRRKAISRELYNFCLDEKIADKNLIAKWKKPGYENLCCLRCIQTRDTNFGTNCICRVPKGKLEEVRTLKFRGKHLLKCCFVLGADRRVCTLRMPWLFRLILKSIFIINVQNKLFK